jgi:uncharacterized protein (TIGR03000 family)
VRRIPPLLALVLGLSAVSARGQSRLTEGNIPVSPPGSSWSDNYRPVSDGPAQVTALALAVVYVPVYGTAPAAAPATVVVRLPADARLTFDGAATRSTGAARTFQSPPLEAGAAGQYVLRAEIVRDGRTLSVRHRVQVRAGTVSEVHLDPEKFRVVSR